MSRALVRIILVAVQAATGVLAVFGGLALIFDVWQLPLSQLGGTPFSSWAGPGWLLLILIGGSSLGAALSLWIDSELGPWIALAAGMILVIWILVQMAMIGVTMFLQPLFLVVGIVMVILAALLYATQSGATQSGAPSNVTI